MPAFGTVHVHRLVVACGLVLLAVCCDAKGPPSLQTPRPPRATLRIVAMTDLSGYLEPCGCQSRPLGGIDKAAARLRELRADGSPILFVAAGDLFFAPESHVDPELDGSSAEAATQQQWQAEALAKILAQLGMVAATPGPADQRFGLARLRELGRIGGFPLLDGSRAPGAPEPRELGPGANPAQPHESLLLTRAGTRIGLWGLSDQGMSAAVASPPDLRAQAKRLTAELRARGAAVVIGLLQADARTARRLAGATAGLDFLVHGGSDSPQVLPPERVGGTTLLRAAHRGHGLLVVDVMRAGDGPLLDISPWTRRAQQLALGRRIDELSARVAEWERDRGVARTALAEQQAQLARLREELAALELPVRAQGNVFSARFVELDTSTPSDPDTRALLDAYNKRVNEHSRSALANVLPKPATKGQPSYLGSARCGDCHEAEFAWWKGQAHGLAYATLERRNTQFNLSCVGCHVTGYNQAGGSTAVHVDGLTNVGCESCHGPGSVHVADAGAEASRNVRREVPEAVCKRCHNPEHSDRFEYATYRGRLIVEGHGLRAESAR
jgi:2',3'-cyclic-nucleotide 2'-phosphodiesterase (5'-nucleotidase family)